MQGYGSERGLVWRQESLSTPRPSSAFAGWKRKDSVNRGRACDSRERTKPVVTSGLGASWADHPQVFSVPNCAHCSLWLLEHQDLDSGKERTFLGTIMQFCHLLYIPLIITDFYKQCKLAEWCSFFGELRDLSTPSPWLRVLICTISPRAINETSPEHILTERLDL